MKVLIRIKKNYHYPPLKKGKLVYDVFHDDYEGQNCDYSRGCAFYEKGSWCCYIDPSIYDKPSIYRGFNSRDEAVNECVKRSLARLDGVIFLYDKNNPSKYIKLVK